MSEIKVYDCHNTNTICDTRKYVRYEDFLLYKEKAEAEVAIAKNLIDRILYAHKEGVIVTNRKTNLTSHMLAEAAESLLDEARRFKEKERDDI